MLGFFILPTLLTAALIYAIVDDDDDDDRNTAETTAEEIDVPEDVEFFEGSEADEKITARDAGGIIDARGGNDTIVGSAAIDSILAGEGDDVVFAAAGDDAVSGSEGDDRVFLGDGEDVYAPDESDPESTAGDDFVRGGADDDIIMDSLGANTIFGDLGDDVISVVDGLSQDGTITVPTSELGSSDEATGGFGDDGLLGDDGDTLTGGADEDLFGVLITSEREQDVVDITDFDTEEDALAVINIGPEIDDNILEFEYDEDEQLVRASADGLEVAILRGLTESDIPNIRFDLIQVDELTLGPTTAQTT